MTVLRGSNASFRAKVYDRDKGVCTLCGLDTEALAQRFREAAELDRERAGGTYECLSPSCGHVGNSQPCESCGGRFVQTLACNENRAAVTADARRAGFKPIEFLALMQSKRSLWIADHIELVSERGTDALENGRTLCVPCNHKVTGQQTRERNKANAKKRKPANERRAIVRTMRGIK